MKYAFAPSLIALALAAPASAQQESLRDYQLPPDPVPTATPEVQGPVDTEGPVPVRPQVIPTTPPARAPTTQPAPTATGTPRVVLPEASPPSTPAAQRENPPEQAPLPRIAPPTPAPRTTVAPGATIQPQVEPQPAPQQTATAQPSVPPISASIPAARNESEDGAIWPWLLLALLAAGATGFILWQRKRETNDPAPIIAPPIVKPRMASGGAAAKSAERPALTIRAEAIRVSRSVMNVTLSYRLSITNDTDRELADIRIGGDLVSAHGSLPAEQQLADRSTQLQQVQTVARIAPGEIIPLSGEIRLPLQQVTPLRQGNSPLLVPLFRLRAEGKDFDPVLHTYVVGLRPPQAGTRLQPFRLDETPQGYTQIGLRALA